MSSEWVKVIWAADCADCECCGEPVCPVCNIHYADCGCPGPTQEEEFEYKEGDDGELYARPISDT